MVQYKKDEIKEKIDWAALNVFLKKGYKGSKILDIAQMASVSVGNIYRYYKSKNEIFHSIISENFVESVRILLEEKVSAMKGKKLELIEERDEFWIFNDDFIDFMVNNREKLLLLFQKSKGTKYENSKSELNLFIMETVKKHYTEQYNQFLEKNGGDFIITVIYENLMNMVLKILEEKKDVEEVKRHLKSINSYHMFGVANLFK